VDHVPKAWTVAGCAWFTWKSLGEHVVPRPTMMCVLNSTRKRTNRLQYSVCKCEVESTGKWSNIGVLFNQPHFNLVPKV
jgi:hypothetical protein